MHLASCPLCLGHGWLIAYAVLVGHAMCRALRSRHCHALHVIPCKPHAFKPTYHAVGVTLSNTMKPIQKDRLYDHRVYPYVSALLSRLIWLLNSVRCAGQQYTSCLLTLWKVVLQAGQSGVSAFRLIFSFLRLSSCSSV